MCAAVSFDVKPLNVALICIVWAVGSSTTVARPVPGDTTGGTSFAPERLPANVIGIALAAGACSIRAPIKTNAGEKYLISALLKLVWYLPEARLDRPPLFLTLSRFGRRRNQI
jgi:hypothetical protein